MTVLTVDLVVDGVTRGTRDTLEGGGGGVGTGGTVNTSGLRRVCLCARTTLSQNTHRDRGYHNAVTQCIPPQVKSFNGPV